MKALALIFFCILPIAVFSQWTTLGNNIYNSNTGYVGIGLQAPTAKLHTQQASNTDWATYLTNFGGEVRGCEFKRQEI
jgi:hypothetical protein